MTSALTSDLGIFAMYSHGLAAVLFLGLALYLVVRPQQSMATFWLTIACLATAVWAAVSCLALRFGADYVAWISLAETLRTAAWIVFLVALLAASWRLGERVTYAFIVAAAMGFVFAAQLLMDLLPIFGFALGLRPDPLVAQAFSFGRLGCAIGGIVLVENVYRNAHPNRRWGVRTLCIGLVALFAYDIYLYTGPLLTTGLSDALFAARGLVHALVAPLILIAVRRERNWKLDIQVSRHLAFHSVSLIATGVYLLLMSVAVYGLRAFGGGWGTLIQVVFVFAALVFAALVFASGKTRAWLRVKINKHFFAYKYDYRAEWLRFIGTAAAGSLSNTKIEENVIQAVCDVVDSPGGIVWIADDNGDYAPTHRWNFRAAPPGRERPDGAFVRFLAERQRIVNFDELRDGTGDYGGMALPAWAAEDRRAWLAIPLLHRETVFGFLVLERTRAARSLNWEDFDLLRTLGLQASSYLAAQKSQRALLESQQFDEFNRRFAFILHDIKNLVSQLSLVVRNAEKFKDNREFQADMMQTLRDSVAKMNDLLHRLSPASGPVKPLGEADVTAVVQAVVAAKAKAYPALSLVGQVNGHLARADEALLEQVFAHLIQNAIDASAEGKPIQIRLEAASNDIKIDVIDQGCGMSEDFVRNRLFQPFQSTKTGGYGIGAYEAREIVRGFGGRLEVSSRQGIGSTFSVTLPLA
jgi:putative PEP-CTERM system histidine kinase